MKCQGIQKNKNQCKNSASVDLPDGTAYCRKHIPWYKMKAVELRDRQLDESFNAERLAINTVAARRIEQLWHGLAPLRRVPPPDELVFPLLLEIQDNKCLLCSISFGGKRFQGLAPRIEDHDHTTGMVRAILCRSCNAQEGHGPTDNPKWIAYRKYAPGIGLFSEYFGHGMQWGIAHPAFSKNRVVIEDCDQWIKDAWSGRSLLNRYLEFIEDKETTLFSIEAARFFDDNCPVMFADEEFKRNRDLYEWPIVDAKHEAKYTSEEILEVQSAMIVGYEKQKAREQKKRNQEEQRRCRAAADAINL